MSVADGHCQSVGGIVRFRNFIKLKNTFCHIQKDYVKLGYKFFKQDGGVSGSGALKDKMSPKIPVKGKSDYSLAPDGSVLSAVYGRVFIRKKPKQ